MDTFEKMAEKIIQEQEGIIGEGAGEEARKVPGLKVDWPNRAISIEGDEKVILEKLVEQYRHLFGQTSVEVCKEAIKGLQVSPEDLPALLK